ncbi:MAG: hypothetical protein GY833_09040 [Aestuariibacter sp.]|nr:hypothetical protein [Aestuariibacter sp.]
MYYYFFHPWITAFVSVIIPIIVGFLAWIKTGDKKRAVAIAVILGIVLLFMIPFTLGLGYWAQ